jgi:hypothetical protein
MERRLADALLEVHAEPAAAPHLASIGVLRFGAVARRDFDGLAVLAGEAAAAGYTLPA